MPRFPVRQIATDADISAINSALSAKADSSAIAGAIAAADLSTNTSLTTALSSKADASALTGLVSSSDLSSALSDKVSSSDLSSAISDKVSSSDLSSALSSKADASALTGLVSSSDLTTALATKAEQSDLSSLATNVDTVTNDLLTTAGRKLLYGPGNLTGTGSVVEDFLSMPSGLSPADGSKYRINGTFLARLPDGTPLGQTTVSDHIVWYRTFPAWNPMDQGAGTYDTGYPVTADGHGWRSTVDNNAAQPSQGSHVGWDDLGAGASAEWHVVLAGETTTHMEAAGSSYFSTGDDLPSLGSINQNLTVAVQPGSGQTVAVEFDGMIADIGANS